METRQSSLQIDRPATGVATITLNRPERMNAMSPSTVDEFAESLAGLSNDPDVRAIVLTGTGRAFCSGMDLAAADEMPPQELVTATEWMRRMHAGAVVLNNVAQPVIAAVNGPAIGGGFGMALGCDIRIASRTALFRATFIKMAMGPDAGLSHSLAKIVGDARALELLLTGEALDADAALAMGIVSRVVDDPLADAIALAETIASVPAHASQKVKATLRRSAHADMDTTLRDIEPAAQAELICHPDFFTNALTWLTSHNYKAAP